MMEEDRESPRATPNPTISFVQGLGCNRVVFVSSILSLLGVFTVYKFFKKLIFGRDER